MRLTGAALVVLLFAAACRDAPTIAPVDAPSSAARAAPLSTTPTGQRVTPGAQTISIPIYDWTVGASGPVLYGLEMMGVAIWPLAQPSSTVQTQMYLVVYPTSSYVHLQCYDVPEENCPDHGPVIAQAAADIMPDVYGPMVDGVPVGVRGHDHLGPPHGKDFRVAEYPTLVLFTSTDAAKQHLTTRAEVLAAALSGDVLLVDFPEFSFHNSLVNRRVWEIGTPWVCPAYTFCPPTWRRAVNASPR